MQNATRATSPSHRAFRWGLLLSGLLTLSVLLGLSVQTYLAASTTAEAVLQARAVAALTGVMRGLQAQPEPGGPNRASLEEVVDELESQDVRFAALVDGQGRVLQAAGTPSGPLDSLPALGRDDPPVVWRASPERARAVMVLGPRHGRRHGRRPMARLEGLDGRRLVVEFEPSLEDGILRRALIGSLLGALATLAVSAAGLVFWRLTRRAEAAEHALERDRQLAVLGEMSAVLGHELKNPLTALKGHAQLLVEKLPADHPGRRGAETVVREAVRLESLTRQVLEFVRTGEVQRAPIDLAALLAESVAALGEAGAARVRLAVPPDLPPFDLDASLVRQALANLLENALQASPPGDPVELGARLVSDGLELSVRDHGPGFAPGEEQQAFEPFFTRKARGTGLGLAVVRRVVEGHGGRARARNHPSGGAEIALTFPREAAP
jgi:two-component system sensor histidine kinase HydH